MAKNAKSGRRSRLIEDRNRLGKLFPKAVQYLEAVLNDDLRDAEGEPLKDKNGKKVVATIAQKLDVAMRVVDQHIGRPAQAVDLTSKVELPPATTTEVVLDMGPTREEEPVEPVTPTTLQEPQILPFEPAGPDDVETGGDWIDGVETIAVLAGSDDSHPVFTNPAT